MTWVSIGSDASLDAESCGIATQPFGLRLQGGPGHYVIHVGPTLMPASC
jgi:hypothetical protein